MRTRLVSGDGNRPDDACPLPSPVQGLLLRRTGLGSGTKGRKNRNGSLLDLAPSSSEGKPGTEEPEEGKGTPFPTFLPTSKGLRIHPRWEIGCFNM